MKTWLALLIVAAVVVALLPPTRSTPVAALEPDWDIPNGHFFTQAAGPGEPGFGITDEGGVLFWSEFQRLGGVNALGYPISERLQWSGFTCQALQRVVLQWRPDLGQAMFVNVFDMMSATGKDDWLLSARQTPKPLAFDEAGKTWDQVVDMRLAVLDANPAIREAYFGAVGDPVTMNGLPTSGVTDMGNNFTVRAQRVVIQQWKVDVPWAAAGQVTFALGGSIAKEAGLLPAAGPPAPPAAAATATATGAPAAAPTATPPGVPAAPPTATPTSAPGCPGPPVIGHFGASPPTISPGGSSTLFWGGVTNVTSLSIDQGIGAVGAPGGTKAVTPGSTTTYTLTAVGCGGTTTAAQTVVVAPAGDLWIIDIGLDTLNRVLMVVGKSGVISAPTYTYRIYRFRAFPLPGGSWVQVYEGTAPVPSGGIGAVTMPYVLPAPVVPFTNRVRVVIDPNNVIPETNEANNTIEQTCDVTVHNCS